MDEQSAVTLKTSEAEGWKQKVPAVGLMEGEDSVNNTRPLKAS